MNKNTYILPSDPRKTNFFGFVFVGRTLTWLSTDAMVIYCSTPGMAMLVFFRAASAGLMSDIFSTYDDRLDARR